MNTVVSKEDKVDFIRWFLRHYKLKRRECIWILNYLLNHEQLISNVHFVEDVQSTSKGMVMSATGTEDIPFRFYNGTIMTADAEKAFHNMRLHPDEKMYIQINFADRMQSQEYLAVLEDIDVMGNLSNKKRGIDVSEDTERLVNAITATTNRISLMNEIDKALDSGDKELFMQLSRMLKEHEETKEVSFSA